MALCLSFLPLAHTHLSCRRRTANEGTAAAICSAPWPPSAWELSRWLQPAPVAGCAAATVQLRRRPFARRHGTRWTHACRRRRTCTRASPCRARMYSAVRLPQDARQLSCCASVTLSGQPTAPRARVCSVNHSVRTGACMCIHTPHRVHAQTTPRRAHYGVPALYSRQRLHLASASTNGLLSRPG